MNLKYYLRGLGLGIIVTALILGIHHSVTKNKKMTDDEVRARAAELGMVESTTLVSADEKTTEEMLKELDSTLEEEKSSGYLVDLEDSDTQDNDVSDVTNDEENAESTEDTLTEGDGTVTEEPDSASEEEETSSKIENTRIDAVSDADDDPGKKDSNSSETVNITISSGDSSYTVAKKLEACGIVPDASEYDTFLCSAGYDRYIRTGTYEIAADASNEEIAKMITGR